MKASVAAFLGLSAQAALELLKKTKFLLLTVVFFLQSQMTEASRTSGSLT